MSEQLQSLQLGANQLAAVNAIADEAITIVDANYGTGYPHFAGGALGNLGYNSGYHGRTVSEDAQRVGEALGFSPAEMITTHVAGRAHDLVQLKPRGQMEAESAEWLEAQLRRRELPEAMVAAGSLAILGTEPILTEDNRIVGQKVTQLEYPSRSAERVALSVASGDFGRVLVPVGPLLAHKLYQQIKGVDPDQVPPMEDLEKFLANQAYLYENYRFPVPEAERILGTHRAQVIDYGREILEQVQRGELDSWAQLEAQDLAFMRAHS